MNKTHGMIDLEAYLNKRSFSRIKRLLFLHDGLLTFNFDKFEYMQLHSGYGSDRYYNDVKMLVDQDLIGIVDIDKIPITEDIREVFTALDEAYKQNQTLEKKVFESNDSEDESVRDAALNQWKNSGYDVHALKERLFAKVAEKKIGGDVLPTLSLDSFKMLNRKTDKSDIYTVVVDNIPLPDDSVPIHDIIQYKSDSNNRIHFLKLRTWANGISRKGLTIVEIQDEIEYLLEAYKADLKSARAKMTLGKIEFAIKIVPHLLENFVKINWSKLTDPIFKVAHFKVDLLKAERSSAGSELAFVARLKEKSSDDGILNLL